VARARLLKPGFFTNDVLAELPATGRILFAGLWTLADRDGRLEDRPRKIKAEVLPYDDDDVDAMLTRLAGLGFLARYERGGIRYIQITNFGKHQSPHVKEPASVIPAPDEPDASPVQAPGEPDASPSSRAHSPIPHSPFPKPIPEAESLTPPTPSRPKAAIAAAVPNAPYRLFARFCEETDADEASIPAGEKGKQLGIAKGLLSEHTEDEVIACLGFVRSQEWRTGLIDLGTVKSEIGKWVMSGCPPRERARAPTNGQRPVTWGEQQRINNEQADAEFAAILKGSNGHESGTISRPDEPARRRLSR
jgi:hypothetical protein